MSSVLLPTVVVALTAAVLIIALVENWSRIEPLLARYDWLLAGLGAGVFAWRAMGELGEGRIDGALLAGVPALVCLWTAIAGLRRAVRTRAGRLDG